MKAFLLLAAGLSLASPAFSQQMPRPAPPAGAKAHRDLAYVDGGHERQKLDLYLPEKSDGPLPVILWIHGGGWMAGSKEQCLPLRAGYVERGYAVASIGYRLSGHALFPAQIEDCKAAIRWLRGHAKEYGLDPERFGVWGGSAGGHLAALVGTSGGVEEFEVGANAGISSRVQAVCDFYGPTDLTVFVTTPGFESHAGADSPETRLLGGVVAENKDKAKRVDPITYVTKDDPPFLLVHGDKDTTVPLNQSQLLFDELKKTGVSVRFHTIQGAGHGGPAFESEEIAAMVAGFFNERLKNGGKKVEALATASAAGQSAGPPSRRGIPWEALTRRDDRNRDGKVGKDEFRGPAALFQRLDRNADGMITRDEHESAVAPGRNR